MQQLSLALEERSLSTIDEARRRGLDVDADVAARDRRLVGVIGGLIAGLNHAMEEASAAGIDVVLNAHFQDVAPPASRRCVVVGRMSRLAFVARI